MLDPIEKKPSGYYFFGNDIFAIPCFRESFLYGGAASIASSLLTFLFTSNGMKSFHVAYGALMLTTFPYMIYCQEKHYSSLNQLQEVSERLKERTNENYRVMDSLPADDLTPDAVV